MQRLGDGGEAQPEADGLFVLVEDHRDIADIDDENVTISSVGEYDGSEKKPDVELSFDGDVVPIATEPYNNINAGTAQVVSTADAGSNNFTGTRVDTFEIAKADISNDARFTVGEIDEQDYTGFPVVPEVTITDSERPEGEKILIYGQDYTTKAANDGSPSTEAKALITGTGNYCGTREVTFTITSEPTPDPEPEPTPEPVPVPPPDATPDQAPEERPSGDQQGSDQAPAELPSAGDASADPAVLLGTLLTGAAIAAVALAIRRRA